MKLFRVVLALTATVLSTGCYATELYSGRPVGKAALVADHHWHSGVFAGGVDLSGPYDLRRLCPRGWAEIRIETSLPNELVELATFGIYAPQSVSVKCAEATDKPAAEPQPNPVTARAAR